MTSVRVKDRGGRALVKRVAGLQRTQLRVGILAGDVSAEGSEGLTIGDVGTFNEFGTEHIPERSFIRAWYDGLLEEHKAQFRIMLRQVRTGLITEEQMWLRLGLLWQAEIQQRISNGIPPPNADSTITQKGSSTPLIDTGQLRKAISFVVEHGL